jgi:pimeloyl-ACP methyl ester carboxylesterase
MDVPRSLTSRAGVAKPGELFPVSEAARIAGVEEHQITINGVTWRYLSAGSGPPLLLVHGLMGYSWSWRFNFGELAKNFTVIAPDLPGCGFSERSDLVPGSLESDAEGLLVLMDELGAGEFSMLGSSRGGGVAIVLAGLLARRGLLHRLPRVILSAAMNPWSRFGRRRARWFATRVGQQFVIHVAPRMTSILESYYRELYGDPSRIAKGSVAGYTAGLVVPRSFHHLARVMRVWHDDLRLAESTLPLLQELPILLLWGSLDSAVYASSAYELHDRLANSALLIMDGIGHLPYEEAPAEFNRIVCEFLLRHNPPTPLEGIADDDTSHAARPAGLQSEPDQIRSPATG